VKNHLCLFSGIGGFALAARNVGWKTQQFVEIDPYCQKVLAKNFPGVPIHDDIKTFLADTDSDGFGKQEKGLNEDGPQRELGAEHEHGESIGNGEVRPSLSSLGPIDIVTGGFPCQDISVAGKQAGIDGERSGLWTELARVIGEVQPRFAVIENVPMLLSGHNGGWFKRVLWDISQIGYDAEWHCIPASAVGAPHQRDRVWIIAYPNEERVRQQSERNQQHQAERGNTILGNNGEERSVADTSSARCPEGIRGESGQIRNEARRPELERRGDEVADAPVQGLEGFREGLSGFSSWWTTEPDVGRVAHGIPARVDRLRGLGNSIVPQVAEIIFRAIA